MFSFAAVTPCSKDKGNCSHLCLISSERKFSCSCPNGLYLQLDGKTCNESKLKADTRYFSVVSTQSSHSLKNSFTSVNFYEDDMNACNDISKKMTLGEVVQFTSDLEYSIDYSKFCTNSYFFLSAAVPPTRKPTATSPSRVSPVSVSYSTQPSVVIKQQAHQDDGKSNTGLIYGFVGGGVALLFLVLGAVVLYIVARKKRSPKLQ